MSQRGRSGFLSYLLLLSRLLQFEHRTDEVAVSPETRGAARRGLGKATGEAGDQGWEGMGVFCLHPRSASSPAQLEQLARRAQRTCGHRAVPARRAEQPVGPAAGGAVSGRGREGVAWGEAVL